MKIEHLAIWVRDIEKMKNFYEQYFEGKSNNLYVNPNKNFQSYFISFENGCRLELMNKPEIVSKLNDEYEQNIGLIHFAISVGSKEKVNQLTEKLREDGYEIIGEPRTTGDGYYESIVFDPEQNRIEITI